MPAEDTIQAWQAFGIGQSGQLAKESGTKGDMYYIFDNCEKTVNKARPRKKFLGIF